jgi:hypothetical protein
MHVPEMHHIAQLGVALSNNSALASLRFKVHSWHGHGFKFEGLLEDLTGLQRLLFAV